MKLSAEGRSTDVEQLFIWRRTEPNIESLRSLAFKLEDHRCMASPVPVHPWSIVETRMGLSQPGKLDL